MSTLHSPQESRPSGADAAFARIKEMRSEQAELTGDAYFASVDAELVEVGRLRALAEAEGRTGDFFVTTAPEPSFVHRALSAAKSVIS